MVVALHEVAEGRRVAFQEPPGLGNQGIHFRQTLSGRERHHAAPLMFPPRGEEVGGSRDGMGIGGVHSGIIDRKARSRRHFIPGLLKDTSAG